MLLLWVLLAQTSGFTLYEHLWDKWRSGCACCDRRRKPGLARGHRYATWPSPPRH